MNKNNQIPKKSLKNLQNIFVEQNIQEDVYVGNVLEICVKYAIKFFKG